MDKMGDFNEMMNKMAQGLKSLEEKGNDTILKAKSGGGLVSISANGNGEIIDVEIDDSLLEDKSSLQILLISAMNDIIKNVEENKKSVAMGMLGNLGNLGDLFGKK